ncbi:outer membrane transport energization protein TonB [Fodinibius roseus]|uniref:Outer membrane transport energization protein TonB n=1 Tax=Fodinibius roseus TaxID=1194090 RepID=A0A1M4ZJ00_9BACT|nr:energy transducer TonB [Fodinibius roseus]SHF17777.1 outer membrane transport energization protein TonB [Fodinibius roseus]
MSDPKNRRKKPEADLRKYYTLFWEIGMIVALLLFIVAMKVDLRTEKQDVNLVQEQEVVEMEEVIQTQQQEQPPPPPRPQVPVEVPNDEIIEDQDINLDADLNMDQPLEMPPPPEQEEEEDEEDFFVAVEQMPELIGGLGELQQKINYPERARRAGIEGRVIIQFIVTEQGNVEDPKVIRGIGGGCDQEALRVVKQAKFEPGRQRGNPVRVQYSLPIIFRLQS